MALVNLHPQRVFLWHIGLILAIAAGHFAVVIALRDVGPIAVDKVQSFFDLDAEATPAAYFSALALLACACGAGMVARSEADRSLRRFWLTAAALAAFLSLDEAAGVHERFAVVGDALTGGRGVFTNSWWVVYPLLLAPVVAVATPGLVRLDSVTRWRLAVAGTIYLAGAVGFEILQAMSRDAFITAQGLRIAGHIDWAEFAQTLSSVEGGAYEMSQHWLALGEEPLEMTGVACALRAILKRVGAVDADLRVTASP